MPLKKNALYIFICANCEIDSRPVRTVVEYVKVVWCDLNLIEAHDSFTHGMDDGTLSLKSGVEK